MASYYTFPFFLLVDMEDGAGMIRRPGRLRTFDSPRPAKSPSTSSCPGVLGRRSPSVSIACLIPKHSRHFSPAVSDCHILQVKIQKHIITVSRSQGQSLGLTFFTWKTHRTHNIPLCERRATEGCVLHSGLVDTSASSLR
mgnify:CR=1 FL=1